MRSLYLLIWLLALTACTPSPAPVSSPPPTFIPHSPTPLLTSSPSHPFASFTPASTVSPSPLPLFTPPSTPTSIPLHLCSPLGGYTFAELLGIESQPFIPPRPRKDDGHHGVDFAHWRYKDRASLEGAEVQSVLSGVVAASVIDKYPYGNMVIIETPYAQLSQYLITTYQLLPSQSLYLLYAHLKAPSPFQIGDPVTCGETIGAVGSTGASGNPHLHLETRTGPAGVTFASMEYYQTTSTPEERANYEQWCFLGDFILFDPWVLLELGGSSFPFSSVSLPLLSFRDTAQLSPKTSTPQTRGCHFL